MSYDDVMKMKVGAEVLELPYGGYTTSPREILRDSKSLRFSRASSRDKGSLSSSPLESQRSPREITPKVEELKLRGLERRVSLGVPQENSPRGRKSPRLTKTISIQSLTNFNPLEKAKRTGQKIVSGDKFRFREDGFDLDLNYITPRIIAMGMPASGVGSMMLNDVADLDSFLREYHPDHYRIFNVSDDDYNYEQLSGVVKYYGWSDHHAPPFDTLIEVVLEIDAWLNLDEENVAAIHCRAGRSRTGTVIASYLLYSGLAPTPEEATLHFNVQRSEGLSLRLPSQLRVIKEFAKCLELARALHQPLMREPNEIKLCQIKIRPVPLVGIQKTGCTPMVEIYDKKILIPNSKATPFFTYTSEKKYSPEDEEMIIPVDQILKGDVIMKFYHETNVIGIIGTQTGLFRLAFHTSFILSSEWLFPCSELDAFGSDDPLNTTEWEYSDKMEVILYFGPPEESNKKKEESEAKKEVDVFDGHNGVLLHEEDNTERKYQD